MPPVPMSGVPTDQLIEVLDGRSGYTLGVAHGLPLTRGRRRNHTCWREMPDSFVGVQLPVFVEIHDLREPAQGPVAVTDQLIAVHIRRRRVLRRNRQPWCFARLYSVWWTSASRRPVEPSGRWL